MALCEWPSVKADMALMSILLGGINTKKIMTSGFTMIAAEASLVPLTCSMSISTAL